MDASRRANDMPSESRDLRDLKEAGLKITAPRVKILRMLEKSQVRHLSAEDVYRLLIAEGHDIGLATVYRVLTQFEAAGLVIRHNFDESHSVFELKDGQHHDHMVCVRCSRVEEFSDPEIEHRQRQVADTLGFKLVYHNLNLYGICPDCLAEESTSA
jgi:Fur family ferric uptake transcriptional regulator